MSQAPGSTPGPRGIGRAGDAPGPAGPQGPSGVLTDSHQNTAGGTHALNSSPTGADNSAFGASALFADTTGYSNTGFGFQALENNVSGFYNTAVGHNALLGNTSNSNVAIGALSLSANSTGTFGTAVGTSALGSNTTGGSNTAMGGTALGENTTGSDNVAVGLGALAQNTTGSNNVGVGYQGGELLTTGSNNIDIGAAGVAAESDIIRIGTTGTQTKVFIAGVDGVTTGLAGAAVLVDANGQLGTVSSSRRYKEDIQPMADASERLLKLRPVKFRYKKPDAKGEKPIQYGLIAEEVADVFPELVVPNLKGDPETVAYHILPALLLNEYQKEHEQLKAEHEVNQEQSARLALLQNQIDAQSAQLAEVGSLKAKLANLERLTEALAAANGIDAAKAALVSQTTTDSARTVVAGR